VSVIVIKKDANESENVSWHIKTAKTKKNSTLHWIAKSERQEEAKNKT
jgi:hypothetical protein